MIFAPKFPHIGTALTGERVIWIYGTSLGLRIHDPARRGLSDDVGLHLRDGGVEDAVLCSVGVSAVGVMVSMVGVSVL